MAANSPAAVVISASEMPGATARKVAAPAVPSPWKASMMPHTVPNRPMNGVTAPVVASQGRRLSRRVSSSEEAICVARCTPACGWDRRLLAQLVVGAFKHGDQRAGLELLGHGGDVLQALGLAEGAHEAVALRAGAAEQSPFGKDDGPGDNAENQQDEEDGFGDQTAGLDQTGDFAADALQQETAVAQFIAELALLSLDRIISIR